MNTRVKICGIRSLESAKVAIDAGADFIGLNFVPTSKRRVDYNLAKEISKQAKGNIQLVGVFQDQPIELIDQYVADLDLDFVQLHGNEDPIYCQNVSANVIKVFSLPNDFDIEQVHGQMKQYPVAYFLIDREKQGKGEVLDIKKVALLSKSFLSFLAGGLTPENVGTIARQVQPFAVDVAGGIETNGKEDINKIKEFNKMVKQA